MSKRFILLTALLTVAASGILAYFVSVGFQSKNKTEVLKTTPTVTPSSVRISNMEATHSLPGFETASESATPSVVFIKTVSNVQRRSSFWMFDFDPFGRIGKVSSSGSGVILSSDGYIVTNHHVVKNAVSIDVVLNNSKSTYKAEVVGSAPSSDLALLKIDAEGLKAIEIANSDDVNIGQWVLAVGNPFNLTSTVTAGIVSAKGRNINIVNNQFPIESFIQTDAAINPGNSGGALVNTKGQLVGVNTAIASKTGSYVGYGFAIPSNIVVKITNDLKEYGQIQRGFDGIEVADISSSTSEELNGINDGVQVVKIGALNEEAAKVFKLNDVLIKMNDRSISTKADYDEQLAYQRPGDVVTYTLLRDGKEKQVNIKLVNKNGGFELTKDEVYVSTKLGADLMFISKLEQDRYNIEQGIKVTNISSGRIRQMNLPDGYVIVKVNNQTFDSYEAFEEYFSTVRGQIRIQGIMPDGQPGNYSFYSY
jgi:serine protease Do